MKHIDAEKLIAEIERRIKELEKTFPNTYYEGEVCGLKRLLSFIEPLQQEQPQVADASKMERLNVDILRDWSMKFAPGFREMIEATAYHFWDLAIYSMKEK